MTLRTDIFLYTEKLSYSTAERLSHCRALLIISCTRKTPALHLPSFMSGVTSEVWFSFQDEFYNMWDEDIALVNIFFGKDTVMGEKKDDLTYQSDI